MSSSTLCRFLSRRVMKSLAAANLGCSRLTTRIGCRSIATSPAFRAKVTPCVERPLGDFKLVKLTSRSLIKLSGPDVTSFLQGLITNDVRCLSNDCNSLYAMILNLKGRVFCDLILYNHSSEDTKLVEVASSQCEQLLKLFKKYKIRKKVQMEHLPGTLALYAAFGCVNESPLNDDSYAVYRDPRLPELGYRIISYSRAAGRLDGDALSEDAYTLHRYGLGVGEGPLEHIPDKALPLECNLLQLNGVSFSKGCYIGQELTARSHHTGVIRKRLMPITVDRPCDVGETCEVKAAATDKTVGHVRGYLGGRGVALLRLSNVLNEQPLYLINQNGEKVDVCTKKPHWWPDDLITE